MKKQILCSTLAFSLLLCPFSASAASFTDVSDASIQQAAAVLSSLGVMEGEGGGRFNPTGLLTRAQFCKLAVTALGITDVSPYENYTVFPDVPTSHWASGYVNAALKQVDIREKQVIRGFADGTFGPDKTISYGEVCTMLLRMLGYQIEDVGPFWPADYIAKAEALNINRGIKHYNAGDIVTRGDAAVLLLNAIQATPKKGEKLLANLASSSTISDSILLATSETDSELRKGQVRFYESGSIQIRSMADTIDRSLIGTRGTVLFDKVTPSKVRAFVPENGDNETVTVRRAYVDRIETDNGKYKIPSKTPMVINGELLDYGKAWTDLTPDYQLNIFYDDGRQIELISTATPTAGSVSFVFGTHSSVNVPANFTLLKNGVQVDLTKLKQYDLVALNPDTKTAIISDKRVTGYLQAATPSFGHPTSVTVLGHSFQIPQHAASYFKDMKFGDRITLLMDNYGNVQAAFPASAVTAENVGLFTGSGTDGATVQLFAGVTLTGKTDADSANLIGQIVRVSGDKNGNLTMGSYSASKVSGNWSIADRKMGTHAVSPNVKLYEQVADKAPAAAISDTDILLSSISENKIRSTILDSAGSIVAIILDDVTGFGWEYGLASVTSASGDEGNTQYIVSLKTFENGDAVTKTFRVNSQPSGATGGAIGLPKGADLIEGGLRTLPVKPLQSIGSVSIDAFDGTDGVRTSTGYYTIPDDIGVYVEEYGKMIPLRDAKSNYSRFLLYGDSTANGSIIRMITAS